MAENIPGVVWSTDRELRFTASFGAGLSALDLRPNEVLGMSVLQYFGSPDGGFIAIVAHRQALQGQSVAYEHHWRGRTYRSQVEPLRDGDGQIVGCIGIAHDITDYKQAEQALRDARDQLEQRVAERTAELATVNESLRSEIEERRHAQDALVEEKRKLQELLKSHDRERLWIAYDIHDNLTQQLAAAIMQFQCHEQGKSRDSQKASENYKAGMRILGECLSEARRLYNAVRSPILDQWGVVAAIENFVCECQGPGKPRVEFESRVQFTRLEPAMENAIFRIVQEGVAYACRHRAAEVVRVELAEEDRRVRLEIVGWTTTDDSENVTGSEAWLGGIRQRARLAGGSVTIACGAPGAGNRLAVELPLALAE
jgi:PAS domain S-box-containing protein